MSALPPLLGAAIPPPGLVPEETEIVAEAQKVLDDVIASAARANDERGRYPTESMAALRGLRAMTSGLAADLGGGGASHRCSLELQVRLAVADSAVAQVFKVHDELTREIVVYCPDAQRRRLGGLVAGGAVLGLAVAEGGRTAEDPLTTIATPTDDGGFVVDGRKIYTTGAAEADHIATWAFNPAAATEEVPILGMQLLLIPRGTPGVTVHRDWDALGQRATDSGTITFDAVQCPPEWVASVPGRAPLPHASLRYQAGFAAVLVGIGVGAIADAVPFVAERSRPWAAGGVEVATEDPYVRRLTGELTSDLAAAHALTIRTADLLDAFERDEISRTELAVPIYAAKAAASRAALRATSELHSLMGTRSVAAGAGFDRWWRNARTLSLHDPVDWKHAEIGQHVLTGWDPPPGIYR